MLPCLVRASWKRLLKEWKRRRLYQSLLAHPRRCQWLSAESTCKICVIFWRRVHLHSTAAGDTSTNSRTTKTTTGTEATSSLSLSLSNKPDLPRSSQNSDHRGHFSDNLLNVCVLNLLNITLSPIPGLPRLPPSARLPHCLCNWQAITANCWVLHVVQGYQLDNCPSSEGDTLSTNQPPTPVSSGRGGSEAAGEGCYSESGTLPRAVSQQAFLVRKKDGSFHQVVNLKPLNQFILKVHFKMEGITMLRDLLSRNDWMASIDLKDAYLSVAVEAEHRKYLRFVWVDQMYEFQCLPFGLSSAPRVFTKLLKPVVGLLRHQGIRLVIFLDDILVLAQSKEDLGTQMDQIAKLFNLLGFSINHEKSQLIPTQQIQYLGFLIDSQNLMIRLTQEKVEQLTRTVKQQMNLSVRDLAWLIGRMTATIPAIFQAPLRPTKKCLHSSLKPESYTKRSGFSEAICVKS